MYFDIIIKIILTGVVLGGALNLAGLLTWVERKQSAVMQDRIGANRASLFGLRILGLFHPLADMLKLILKEDFTPRYAHKILHALAPFVSVFFALIAFAAIPIGNDFAWRGHAIHLQVAHINVGLLYILSVMSMGVYGVVLAGFASNNNYSFLGGLRASSQMISYEITMGVSIMGIVMMDGSLNLQNIVQAQGQYWHHLPLWGIFLQPVSFFLFLTAAMAETKRTPFDLPEGESEIIGYFVEYSGMKFGMFFLTDFLETVLASALLTTLFLGGWQIPYLFHDGFHFPWGTVWIMAQPWVILLGVIAFSIKVIFFCWFLMMIRWTLPRFRYDQLMRLGWKIMLPISLINILVTGLVMVLL
ncbi:MAG: NADH-quinone oxidoreductase subunit NuoH [Chlamydiae bacterium]|nr:NADH-quinone oxidoreductase subunit NuoH [Chlamydiota bacterium]MBI3267352.1 NADH-quinone oxidoreductase subunit NuoH [Chlamydiota bacterium]